MRSLVQYIIFLKFELAIPCGDNIRQNLSNYVNLWSVLFLVPHSPYLIKFFAFVSCVI